MRKIEKIEKARKKMKVLMVKQEKIFNDLLDDLGQEDSFDCLLVDYIFNYLYDGTNYSLGLIKESLAHDDEVERKTPKSWWHR